MLSRNWTSLREERKELDLYKKLRGTVFVPCDIKEWFGERKSVLSPFTLRCINDGAGCVQQKG